MPIADLLPEPKNDQLNQAEPQLQDGIKVATTVSIPPYGQRANWRPKTDQDYGENGGAYPEIPVAQFPYGVGRKPKKSNAVALISSQSIKKDAHQLVPLRQQGTLDSNTLIVPTAEEVEASTEKTQNALQTLLKGSTSDKNDEPEYIQYRAPTSVFGEGKLRMIKIVTKKADPLEPPKFRLSKVPARPSSPPQPLLRSPPRKLTADEQKEWKIPSSISNWKNPQGYTIAIDKRVAADGRSIKQEVVLNEKHAKLAEAVYQAEVDARQQVNMRQELRQKLADEEREAKEERLRELARQVRAQREMRKKEDEDDLHEDDAVRLREQEMQDLKKQAEKELRMSRMGSERKVKAWAKEQNRDISGRVLLGASVQKPSADSLFDSRLFGQKTEANTMDEENVYSKSLFSAKEAIQNIYRPTGSADENEVAHKILADVEKNSRFETSREGPVEFERAEKSRLGIDNDDAVDAHAKRRKLEDGK